MARPKYFDPRALAKIGRLNLVARQVVEGTMTGLHRSPFHGFSVEFTGYREYVRGDDLRYLDWKVLGKADRRYVKQFQEETNLKAHLLVDGSASMTYTSGGLSKWDYGCYLAASLAHLMIRQGDAVGLVLFDEEVREHIPPRARPNHLQVIYRALEDFRPGRKTGLGQTFHDVAERIKRRGLIVVVSDLFDPDGEVMRGLRHFRRRKHEVILFHLTDPRERDFAFEGLTDFVDLETGRRVHVNPRLVRRRYREQLDSFVREFKRVCAESRIDFVTVPTERPFEEVLIEYVSRRSKWNS